MGEGPEFRFVVVEEGAELIALVSLDALGVNRELGFPDGRGHCWMSGSWARVVYSCLQGYAYLEFLRNEFVYPRCLRTSFLFHT